MAKELEKLTRTTEDNHHHTKEANFDILTANSIWCLTSATLKEWHNNEFNYPTFSRLTTHHEISIMPLC